MKEQMVKFVKQLQNEICDALEQVDGKAKFKEDSWERPGGGGGWSRVIENGNVLEKGGVNVSVVEGEMPEAMKKKFKVDGSHFFATGISLVIHPTNPHCPTSHANWRYFEMSDAQGNVFDSWFGGGLDLTPYYLYENDAIYWHKVCKETCDQHHPELYGKYKQWCDEYFYNSHRGEERGIGGLFFDYLRDGDMGLSKEEWFAFVQDVGNSYTKAYCPILEKRKDMDFTDQEKYWQEIRRGRYVEFNLIHDRGTLFGLKTNGRTESILMSLPPTVRWDYDFKPFGEREQELVDVLEQPKNWI